MKATIIFFLFCTASIAFAQNSYQFNQAYNVAFGDSAVIKGRVISKTYPAAGVMVSIGKSKVFTDSLGHFKIRTSKKEPVIKFKSKRFHDLKVDKINCNKGEHYSLSVSLLPQLDTEKKNGKSFVINTIPNYDRVINYGDPIVRHTIVPNPIKPPADCYVNPSWVSYWARIDACPDCTRTAEGPPPEWICPNLNRY